MGRKTKHIDPSSLGAHLRRLRELRRLTQDELAELSDLAADTIRRLEHEEFSPSLRTLKQVTRALELTLTSLFGSWEMDEFQIPRGFSELFATRSRIEQEAFAVFWKELVPELDGVETHAAANPDDEQDATTSKEHAFGRYVRLLRRARGMTQEVLAERCGLSADTIRRLEHGSFSPSLDTLRKLCKGLDLRLGTLFEAFDLGEPDVEREILDFLWLRSPAERLLGYRVLRAFFDLVDKLTPRRAHG